MRLTGKRIVIAGAGGGLGTALSERFHAEGAQLVLGDANPSAVVDLAVRLPDHARVRAQVTDVREAASVAALIDAAVDEFGGVDVVVNNAGILGPNARLHNLTPEDWAQVVAVNLMGAVNGMTAAVRAFRSAGRGGVIVNTASVAAFTAWPYAAAYCATKAAIVELTKVAAVEYARDGIRVNCVCPGTFRTAIHDGLPEEALAPLAAKHPLGLGSPTDIVGAYVLLASDEATWMTGSAVVVDGGYSAP